MQPATTVSFTFDASPFGLGGFVSVNGSITEYFADVLSPFDTSFFNASIGDAAGQQTWEALALLVGLRAWSHLWKDHRCALMVEGDNVGALTLIAKFKAAGRGPGIIAREVALLFSEASFEPRVVSHVPGISNVIADMLSRKHDPNKPFALPLALADAREIFLPPRDASYFLSLRPAVQMGGGGRDCRGK